MTSYRNYNQPVKMQLYILFKLPLKKRVLINSSILMILSLYNTSNALSLTFKWMIAFGLVVCSAETVAARQRAAFHSGFISHPPPWMTT